MNINNKEYNVIIKKKKIKNTYLRIDENENIVITTNHLTPNYMIKNFIESNINYIEKKISKKVNNDFYYLGVKYDIVINENIKDIIITDDTIYVKNETYLTKWLDKQTQVVFEARLKEKYNTFSEKIKFPGLKIRKMKTRWGVCNIKGYITLNSNLIKYSTDVIDYVIVHELSHFVHFNHSKDFWDLVYQNCPNYKECKKTLKE